jgi:hypothetical protein
MTWLMLALLGCPDEAPSGVGGCQSMSRGAQRDACYVEHAVELFKQDRDLGTSTVVQEVSDPAIRDFIWLTVTRDVDPTSDQWCRRIESEAIAARCRVLVRRPHLHRAIEEERNSP